MEILKKCGTSLIFLIIYFKSSVIGEGFSALQGKFNNLNTLGLVIPSLTDRGFQEFLKMSGNGLENLVFLGNPQLTCRGLHEFRGRFPNLKRLNVMICTELADEGLSELLNLCGSELQFLRVERTNVSGVGLNVPSGKLSNLTELTLRDCSLIDEDGLSSLLNLCSDKLKTLGISRVNISEEFLVNVQESLPGLRIVRN